MTYFRGVYLVLEVVAGRSHPSGGPTWPLNGLSIVALGGSAAGEVWEPTTFVADVALLFGCGWRTEKPGCWLRELKNLFRCRYREDKESKGTPSNQRAGSARKAKVRPRKTSGKSKAVVSLCYDAVTLMGICDNAL